MRTSQPHQDERPRGQQRPALLGHRLAEPGARLAERATLMGIKLLRRPVGRDQVRARVARERANAWLLRVGRKVRSG